MAEVDYTFDLEDELTEEQRRLMNIRAAKAVGIAPNLGPPPPMTIDGIPAREFTTRENMAQQQGKTFQQTDEGVGFQGRELIGPAAVAEALSANKAAPANAAAGFTPPPDIAPPPNLNPLAGVSLPDQRMQDIRGQMAGIREAMANEIPVTASQDEVDQLAAAGQPVPTGVPSPAFDDPVGATADPLAALEMAQAFAQPQIDMPPPGLPGFDPQTDPLNIMPNLPEDLDAAVASAGLPPQSEYGQPIPGYFDAGESNFSARLNELEARLAEEEDLEGAAGLGQNINRGASRIGRGSQGLGQDIAEGAVELAGDVWDPISDFVGGLSRSQGGPAMPTADAATVPRESVDGDGAAGGEQGGEARGDLAEIEVQEKSRQDPDLFANVPASGEMARSNQAGVESGPVTDFVSRPNRATAADRALGAELLPRDQRGSGVEVIRGLRRTFQPIDGPTSIDENGNTIGGSSVGGEIPFGRGTIDRFFNMGFTMDEAADLAFRAEQADTALIAAGAQALVAATNAVLDDNVPMRMANGDIVRGMIFVDPSSPGGIRMVPTTELFSLGQALVATFTEIDTTSPTGELIKLKTPVFFEKVLTDDGTFMRQVPIDVRDVRLAAAANDPEFGEAYDQAGGMDLVGEARMNKALQLLDDFNKQNRGN